MFFPLILAAAVATADWSSVAAALGRAGAVQPGDVYKVSFPRTDLDVTVDAVHVRPALALGSWAAFMKTQHGAIAMGDLVLLEGELNDVISTLQAGGIEQTAVHNHLIGESPHVVYVHFNGHGDAPALAKTLHDALTKTKTPIAPPPAATTPPAINLPTPQLDATLGFTGKANGGTYQFSIPRAEKITDHDMVIPPAAGVATAINFQSTANGKAAITGDFVLIASEVNPVIRALRNGGIAVTALHSHMLTESPRLFFMHFWANDDPVALARTLRRALDAMNISRPTQ